MVDPAAKITIPMSWDELAERLRVATGAARALCSWQRMPARRLRGVRVPGLGSLSRGSGTLPISEQMSVLMCVRTGSEKIAGVQEPCQAQISGRVARVRARALGIAGERRFARMGMSYPMCVILGHN